ncbi:MAG TPA: CRISPR-associated endonuclease Cas1 [Verrucomicrobiota bacterium]|nr:CRISPR-associated endonuclease Cas1 [Verrucomicrobiota bacterium]HQB17896.1 CRISPR-associated endonuclease Cas1 [Verrucomicrobiota bacterium]
MPTLILNQAHCRVALVSERLEIYGPPPDDSTTEQRLRTVPLLDVERVVAGEDTHFTPAALAAILRRQIPIQFFAWNGRFLGSFLPAQNHHGLSRLRQYQRTEDPAFVLPLAGRLVAAKIYNQRRVLQRLRARRSPDAPAAPAAAAPGAPPEVLDWLNALLAQTARARSLDELRGYEGAASARYFPAWAAALPPAFPFEQRSIRPPRNPVNACISFGATLLYHEAVAFIHAHGLDPALGLLHATENGRWSLALDLIEPFRPVLVEALALDLFSHQILNHAHFDARDGGCYLNEAGRKKFFLQYERRMERQFLSESAGHRTTLRQQLEQQAVQFKTALDRPEIFEPFLMN